MKKLIMILAAAPVLFGLPGSAAATTAAGRAAQAQEIGRAHV